MYRVGIDIGGTKINIGLFNGKQLIEVKKLYISDISDICNDIEFVVDDICKEKKIGRNEIAFCGVGIPGTVNDEGTRIIKAPNISILGADFRNEIERKLNMPVRFIQDSRAAAWGEYLCGGGRGYSNIVCVTLGTGIGTGIILNGKIYNGPLGFSGELGHLPVCENGRECGCGKRGCLEKYCAGGGLDITAEEILGSGMTSKDLFDAAKGGNSSAIEALQKSVELLGKSLVSIINLIAPECLLFSGGLSTQKEYYLNPLIDYIKNHCYSAEKMPIIKKAELNEYSPLYGAALFSNVKHRKPILSASIMCADIMNMGEALSEINDAGIQYLHCDIMDNHFVPNLMLPMELLNSLRKGTDMPFDFHVMAENPETIIEKLDIHKNDIVSVHYESTVHLEKIISQIKQSGAKAAVALNPATPIEVLNEIIAEIDMVLIMSVNPGFAGQKIVPTSFDKIRRMKKMLEQQGRSDICIEVDGNCSFENVPKMFSAGADIFVVGTSSVFRKDLSIKEGTEKLLRTVETENSFM